MKKKKIIKYNKCLIPTYQHYREFLLNNKEQEYIKHHDLEKIFEYYSLYLMNDFICDEIGDEYIAAGLSDIASTILFNDIKGKTKHIFIQDSELYKLLESIPVKDIKGMKDYIKEYGEETIFYSLDTKLKDLDSVKENKQKRLYYCIHFPEEINKDGLAVRLRIVNDELVCDCIKGHEAASFSSESKYLKHPELETDRTDLKMWQLTVNTFFYMKTFPECVKLGVPSGFTFDFPTTSEKLKLGTSEKILETRKQINDKSKIVTPHFRKGYFRYLGSDYFKEKRGQFVFVHETMVKARETVTLENTKKTKSIKKNL